jgi:hypothetical protein
VASVARKSTQRVQPRGRLNADEAIIALLIGAMEANAHVSPREAERAHNLIWSMRRFRRRSGEAVGRLIGKTRERMEREGVAAVIERAARALPASLRPAVFASAVDLMLADTTLQREERRFVTQLRTALNVPPDKARTILQVLLLKNGV